MSSSQFLAALKTHNIFATEEVSQLLKDASLFQRQVHGAVMPASQDEVFRAVKVASQFGVSLWPFSGGKNWGYGSAFEVPILHL